jgi:hypothetical protein
MTLFMTIPAGDGQRQLAVLPLLAGRISAGWRRLAVGPALRSKRSRVRIAPGALRNIFQLALSCYRTVPMWAYTRRTISSDPWPSSLATV